MKFIKKHAPWGHKPLGQRGFSLIEMSIVLVIAGLLLTVAVTVMRSLTQSSKLAKEKGNIQAVRNSLIAYALNRGKLPCPDINGDGVGDCPISSCTTSPCALPYIDLNLSALAKDTWSLPYHYDATTILTTTNTTTLCSTLHQLHNLHTWYGSPANATCGASSLVCATNTTDADNNAIGSASSGYYLAAYVLSRGEDKVLGGKNSADGGREYEMAANPYDTTVGRDDLVGEVSFADIADKTCTARNTTMEVVISSGETWLDNGSGCTSGTGLTGTVQLSLGQRLYYAAGCSRNVTFEEIARCDLNPAVYSGTNTCSSGTALNGKVSINFTTSPAAIIQ